MYIYGNVPKDGCRDAASALSIFKNLCCIRSLGRQSEYYWQAFKSIGSFSTTLLGQSLVSLYQSLSSMILGPHRASSAYTP
jgi:hypothetical protein